MIPCHDGTSRGLREYDALLRDDPVFFMRELWADRGLDKHGPIGYLEADFIRWCAGPCLGGGGGPRLRGAGGPRGWGKTYWTCGLPCWYWYRDPSWRVKIVSRSKTNATDSVWLIREWLKAVPFLKHLSPSSDGDVRDSYIRGFNVAGADISRNVSLTSLGFESQITGTRAHIVIVDDIETWENTKTQEARDNLYKRVDEMPRVATFGHKEVLFLYTYNHDNDSLYPKLIKKGYTLRNYPIAVPQKDDQIIGLAPVIQERIDKGELKHTVDRDYAANPTMPYRFDTEDIREKYGREALTSFLTQYMLVHDVGDTVRYPLKLSDLIVPDFAVQRDRAPVSIYWGATTNHGQSTERTDIPCMGHVGDKIRRQILYDTETERYQVTKTFIDPSGVGKDQTALCTVGLLAGKLWVKDLYGFPPEAGFSQEVIDTIMERCRQWGSQEIHLETAGQQSVLLSFLEAAAKKQAIIPGENEAYPNGWVCSVFPAGQPRSQKEMRIVRILEPAFQNHTLVFNQDIIKPCETDTKYELQHQITRLTTERNSLTHDDKIEALAGAVALFQDFLRVTPETSATIIRERMRHETLRQRAIKNGLITKNISWI